MKIAMIASMVAVSVLLSCRSKVDDALEPNVIRFNETPYNMAGGLVLNRGTAGITTHTHTSYTFYIADVAYPKQRAPDGSVVIAPQDTRVLLGVNLRSPGVDGFRAGSFDYIPFQQSRSSAKIENKFYFFGATLWISEGITDEEGNLQVDVYQANGGNVVVSGSPPENFILIYNLQFEDGQTLRGTYSGDFVYFDK